MALQWPGLRGTQFDSWLEQRIIASFRALRRIGLLALEILSLEAKWPEPAAGNPYLLYNAVVKRAVIHSSVSPVPFFFWRRASLNTRATSPFA